MGALLLASGDVWPTITIGFTFRLSQLFVIISLLLLPVALASKTIRPFPGAGWLYTYFVWVLVCLPFSIYPERSLAYTCWVFSDLAIIFAFVQYFDTERAVVNLVRWFTISFVVIAIFGLFQFFLGLAGIDLLVAQWWIEGRLARINGLSYEPSYYATYLIVGWVLSLYLLEKRAEVPSRKLQLWCAWTTTFALILSSSRMGWLVMVLWLLSRWVASIAKVFVWHRIKRCDILLVCLSPFVLALIGIAIVPRINALAGLLNNAQFLIGGLGIFGSSPHSTETRLGGLALTWRAFLDHPFIGSGIGALPVDIAAQDGTFVTSASDAKTYEGTSIFVEALASTGLVGAIFLCTFSAIVVRYVRLSQAQWLPWMKVLVAGLSWAVLWLLLILQFNQNFLRIYLFTSIAVLLCCTLVFSRTRTMRNGSPIS